ncbi:MAG: metallophosphoesterase family protein [Anaerovoracaceae bacterium]|jgi:putative phosphoesterase
MKMLVVSDTHGSISRVLEIAEKITDIDLLVHLGDYYEDAVRIAEALGVDYAAVRGNCDGALRFEDTSSVLETECGRILLTHGHTEGVRRGGGYSGLLSRCEQMDCCAVFFGHTHVAVNDEIDGVRILNPGSISRPRDGSRGSYAIVHTSEQGIECSVLYYNTGGGPPKKKAPGGFLRGLMNYSDGF